MVPPNHFYTDYAFYNRKYWSNKLPSVCPIRFKKNLRAWDEGGKRIDGTHVTIWHKDGKRKILIRHEIWINIKFRNEICYALIILLHEMIHLHLSIKGIGHRGHGKNFRAEKRRIMLLGAYEELL